MSSSTVESVFAEQGLKPRLGQAEASKALAKALKDGLSTVFVAPTGWGKTLAVLAALKVSGRLPALWLIRSLEVGGRVEEDAMLLGLRCFRAAGRVRTCPYAERFGDAVHDYCRFFRASCSYYINLLRQGVKLPATSWEDLLGGDFCPYYAQDVAVGEADIIVQSYYRRLYRASAVIVDEAHNLLAPRERRLSLKAVAEAVSELRALGFFELAEELWHACTGAGAIRLERLNVADYSAALREALARLSRVKGLPKVVRALRSCSAGGAAYREEGADKIMIYDAPWRPPFKPVVYVSATIPERLEVLLSASASVRVPAEPREALVTSWLTSKYGEETVWGYIKLLAKLKFRYRRVLAFASERLAVRLLDAVQYYEETPPPDWRGVLLLHVRGRYAEGVDLPADCVAVLGAPFLPPEVTARLRRYYARIGAGDAALWAPMVITTLQAVGRAARRPGDRPLIILGDCRFAKYSDYFRPYLDLREVGEEELSRVLA